LIWAPIANWRKRGTQKGLNKFIEPKFLSNEVLLTCSKLSHLLKSYVLKHKVMFGLFKKKTEKEKLQAEYEKLLKRSFELSKVNRADSDKIAAQADEIARTIERMG
jgi:hypothetical protein